VVVPVGKDFSPFSIKAVIVNSVFIMAMSRMVFSGEDILSFPEVDNGKE
jgi:hypothetical protein